MLRAIISAMAMSVVASSVSAQGAPKDPISNKLPADVSARVFVRESGDYDLLNALGKLGEFDTKLRTITDYVDVGHFKCKPSEAMKTRINQRANSTAYSLILDKSFEGSISIFTASARMKESERMQVTITDIATADLSTDCALNRQSIARIIRELPGVTGKALYYVTGATMSQFVKQMFSEDGASGQLSAGSWLAGDAKYYKGSGQIDSVPIVSVRGFYLDVPNKNLDAAIAEIESGSVPLIKFDTLLDLGFKDDQLSLQSKSIAVP